MSKRLFDHFTEKFKENLPAAKTMQDAFDKTNQQLGFAAYSSFNSYQTVRNRKRKRH